MNREIIITEDGSTTLYIPELNEHYHSIHGAIQESTHIFIKAGIEYYGQKDIRILEAGFGTGLNAFLTLIEARENQRKVVFHTFEKYPLTPQEVERLIIPTFLPRKIHPSFNNYTTPPGKKMLSLPLTSRSTSTKQISKKSIFTNISISSFSMLLPPTYSLAYGRKLCFPNFTKRLNRKEFSRLIA